MMNLRQRWNRFFFEPQSPATLGIYRIAISLVAFLSILGKFPVRDTFYGANAMISYETMSRHIPEPGWLYFRWMPEADPFLALYFGFTLICLFCLLIGLQTRFFSILACALIISFSNRNMYIDNNGDNLLRISFFFLMFADSGAAYSFDRWWRKRKGIESAAFRLVSPWPQRLLQLQLCYLYFETAWTKNGAGWNDGTALYYALNYLELRRFDFTFLFSNLLVVKIASWSVLAVEYAGALLIWVRKIRYPIVFGLFCLHIGINLSLQFPVFQYVMMASLLNFIDPKHTEAMLGFLKSKLKGKPA
jgi:uncharacterized membrane protein YphA (DoxX/SURF4 family)